MGYSVYWANGRWQGYGVIAICDHKKCLTGIDRGLSFQHISDKDNSPPSVFCCEKHEYANPGQFELNLDKESPDWLKHVLEDESWEGWRTENPEMVEKYKQLHSGAE